jgi:large subunit ribosomal protein L29
VKTSEMREKTPADLENRQRELTEQLFKLRFQRATGTMEKSSKMREVKREIARLRTIMTQKSKA